MSETKADVILHPVRMRIIQTLIGGRKLSVQQMGGKLQDIPQATLYRHLNKLVKAKIIEAVEENPVRGAVEKVYALPEKSGIVSGAEIEKWTAEDHMDAFMRFMAVVMADFERYVGQEHFDLVKDGAGYRQISFYATDEEYKKFIETLSKELMKLASNEEGYQRRKRTLSTIVTSEKG